VPSSCKTIYIIERVYVQVLHLPSPLLFGGLVPHVGDVEVFLTSISLNSGEERSCLNGTNMGVRGEAGLAPGEPGTGRRGCGAFIGTAWAGGGDDGDVDSDGCGYLVRLAGGCGDEGVGIGRGYCEGFGGLGARPELFVKG